LGDLWGPARSEAIDINDAEVVVGWRDADVFTPRAVKWSAATGVEQLPTISGGGLGYGRAINNNGDVAGYSTGADGSLHATLWKHGQTAPIDLNTAVGCTSQSYGYGLNDRGWVAGQCATFAVVWDPNGTMLRLPADPSWGAAGGEARDINNAGEVVGTMAGTSVYWKIKITQPQTVTFVSTPPNPAILDGSYSLTANGGASGNPILFGSLTPSVCAVTGSSVRFIAIGNCVVTADQAGNESYDPAPQATQSFAIAFSFAGFFSPVDNLPTVNVAQAGSAIPVKFSLGGDRGLAILAEGSPSSAAYACTNASSDAIEETVAASVSGLRYDGTQYIYVWKTEKTWARTCRQLTVKLIDGTVHRANFQFK
jgi:probable HAF family extracellular repeat protein